MQDPLDFWLRREPGFPADEGCRPAQFESFDRETRVAVSCHSRGEGKPAMQSYAHPPEFSTQVMMSMELVDS
jgi:hypothetical protein